MSIDKIREEVKNLSLVRRAYGLRMKAGAVMASEPLEKWYWRCREQAIADAPLPNRATEITKLADGVDREAMMTRIQNSHYPDADGQLTRTILLKAPGEGGEKGVLISYFEYNWLRMLREIPDFDEFAKRYQLIFASSWSPTDYGLISAALAKSSSPLLVQACNYAEIPKLNAFHKRLHCTDSLPCDWLDPSAYEPRPASERDIDIVMVANWAPFKRHWHFFKVLKKMSPSLKVVLIGQKQGRYTRQHIERMILDLGLKQEFLIKESIPISEVSDYQCRSKTSAIFSKREGCCVSVVEALFADAPMAILENAHIGPLRYINDQTGCRLRSGRESWQMSELLERHAELSARDWAINNVAHTITAEKLNGQLKALAGSEGLPWTRDISLPVWRPYPMLHKTADRDAMQAANDALAARYPSLFPSSS